MLQRASTATQPLHFIFSTSCTVLYAYNLLQRNMNILIQYFVCNLFNSDVSVHYDLIDIWITITTVSKSWKHKWYKTVEVAVIFITNRATSHALKSQELRLTTFYAVIKMMCVLLKHHVLESNIKLPLYHHL